MSQWVIFFSVLISGVPYSEGPTPKKVHGLRVPEEWFPLKHRTFSSPLRETTVSVSKDIGYRKKKEMTLYV